MSNHFYRGSSQLLLVLAMTSGCATLLDLDGDYREGESAGGADTGNGGFSAAAGKTQSGSAGKTSAGGSGTGSGGEPGSSGSQSNGAAGTGGGQSSDGGQGNDGGQGGVSPLLRVIHGQTTLASGSSSRSVTIDRVTSARSFLVFGTAFDSSNSSRTELSGQLSSDTELTFKRVSKDAAAPNVPVEYYVAEFGSGVSVQRGSTTLSDAVTRVKLAAPVALDHSFPLVTFRNAGSVYGLDDHVRAKLTGASELTLEMYQAFGDGVVEWQVVSFDGATVQAGDVAVEGGAAQVASSLASAVDPEHTWLLLSYQVANVSSRPSDLMLRGRVEPTQVVFERAATGASATLTYYTVSFQNGTAVRAGNLTLAADAKTSQLALSGIDTSRSLAAAAGNYLRGGSTSYTGANNPGYGSFHFTLESNQLSVTRGASGAAADVSWNVVQFE